MKNRILLLTILVFATFSCHKMTPLATAPVPGTAGKYEFPFQNPSLTTEERVTDLVSRMTIEEKVQQLFNQAPAIERLGVPAYNWWNEALHGVARAGKATVFPQAIGLAATFDEALMLNVATAISDEARAKHHNFVRNNVRSIYAGLTFWSPNINIFRDPRWGRGQETYGEDPFLTGRMAVNFIKGLQGDDPKYLKTIATAKHYAVHSGPEQTRHIDNIFVNDRDLQETYLPAFKMAVREAHVQSVMCAYNRFRDKPCCGSDLLLQRLLRETYGFDGYVVSDCGAITDMYKEGYHNMVDRPAQAWGWSLASGTDLNCEVSHAFVEDHLKQALETGMINEADINKALTRLFTARFQLGLFDPEEQQPWTKIPYAVVGSSQHQALALRAAEQSLVLLKNDGLLPLSGMPKIALIGPNADNEDVLIGNYNGLPINPTTPLKAFRERLGERNVLYAPGSPLVPGLYGHFASVPAANLFHLENGELRPGLRAEYFKNTKFGGKPAMTRVDANIDFLWEKTPISGLLEESFAVRWTGVLKPDKPGSYVFGGSVAVKINGKETGDQPVNLQAGQSYNLEATYSIEPFWWANAISPWAKMSWVEDSKNYEAEALAAASEAEVVVFCGGISPRLEGEEMKIEIDGFSHGDRTNLKLPAIQEELLKKLKATGKPVIYINFSGSAIALNWENDNLPAIVQAFYPGEPAGTALVRLLFGDFSPSGRLPVTFYKTIEDLPPFLEYAMAGRTYRYFKGEPLYLFGYGLSYTDFEYSSLLLPKTAATNQPVTVSVTVTNTGKMDGTEVVQLYLTDLEASTPVPITELAGFKSIFLKKGASETVSFTLMPEQFSLINKDYRQVVEPGRFSVKISGGLPGKTRMKKNGVVQGDVLLEGEAFYVEK